MRIRNKLNGGYAEVSDEYAARLTVGGVWEIPGTTEPKVDPAPVKRRTRKAAAKAVAVEPVEAPPVIEE